MILSCRPYNFGFPIAAAKHIHRILLASFIPFAQCSELTVQFEHMTKMCGISVPVQTLRFSGASACVPHSRR